jgi:Flp pilus assembly protein TadD
MWPRNSVRLAVVIVGVLLGIALGILYWSRSSRTMEQARVRSATSSPAYVGVEDCVRCHASQATAWSQSHHALAMQQANDRTVLGNFSDAKFTKDGVTSSFYQKDGKYYVRTDGPDGQPNEYELPYTFGVFPLQQYLVPFPNGRLQSLVLAWDSRDKAQGGQRWFHLYPNQKMPHSDPLHWTGRNQTWNYMCAGCHSTNLRKNYNLAADGYATTWSEINVSCESCHGPGSKHVEWAQSHTRNQGKTEYGGTGLTVDLNTHGGSWWLMQPTDATMHWNGQIRSHNEIETCAPCHSRRRPITNDYVPGQPFLDAYVPSLLEEGVYYADGQILEEDYEYVSFLQSKMFHEGVTCSDCHDPHSGKLLPVSINSVCGKCHLLAKFDTREHSHHPKNTPGTLCVNCHMPTRTYMVVDVRRDHSFRVPRPDFSVSYGTPNACTQCHKDKSAKWAADAVVRWYGSNRRREARFVEALDAGRRGLAGAEGDLTSLIEDASQPGIARATALSLLSEYLTPDAFPAVRTGLVDKDALVRSAAVRALEPLAGEDRVRLVAPLLTDPIRSVRIEVARLLAGTPSSRLQEGEQVSLDRAISELIASELVSAERPENHVDLALLYVQMGRANDAESELKTALRLDPNFVPAMVNLADFYRTQNRDDLAKQWLEKAIKVAPNAAEPIHALALLMVRQKQYQEALPLLARAAALQPGNTRYSYVYGVALHSSGEVDKSIAVMAEAHRRRPADREVLNALIAFERDKGEFQRAISHARELIQLSPADPQAKALLADLLKRGS